MMMIDARPKDNMARFMNHNCDPNCNIYTEVDSKRRYHGWYLCWEKPQNMEKGEKKTVKKNKSKFKFCDKSPNNT